MKRVCSLLLCIVLIGSMMPMNASCKLRQSYAQAYYSVLDKAHRGVMDDADFHRYFDGEAKLTGYQTGKIFYAHLVDVTGDGVEELFLKELVRSSSEDKGGYAWTRIFTVKDGKPKRIGQTMSWVQHNDNGSYSYYEPPGYIGSLELYFSHSGLLVGDKVPTYICTGDGGKKYIADGMPDHQMNTVTFYAYDGETMEQCDTFWSNFVPDWRVGNVTSNYGTHWYYINGNEVTEKQYKAARKKYISGGFYELKENDYSGLHKQLYDQGAGDYVPSGWAEEAVYAARDEGYLPKNLADDYTNPITRAEFCQLATAFYEKYYFPLDKGGVTFSDTTDESVLKMAKLGIVSGVGGGRFDPKGTLTREMAATILSKLAEKMKLPTKSGTISFVDAGKVSAWAKSGVETVCATGIMSGMGGNVFSPNSAYTREQSVVTLQKLKNLFVPLKKIVLPDELTVMEHEDKVPGAAYSIEPANARVRDIVWKSSKESVCKVDSKTGELEPIKEGTATITAFSAEHGVEANYVVNVIVDTDVKKPKVIATNIPITVDAVDLKADYSKGYYDVTKEVVGKITIQKAEVRVKAEELFFGRHSVYVTVDAEIDKACENDELFFVGARIMSGDGTVVKDTNFFVRFDEDERENEKKEEALCVFSENIKPYQTYYLEFYDYWKKN